MRQKSFNPLLARRRELLDSALGSLFCLSMPRAFPPSRSTPSPPSAATGPRMYSAVDPSVLMVHLNQLREEELIARMRERQQRPVLVAGPLPPLPRPLAASYLAPHAPLPAAAPSGPFSASGPVAALPPHPSLEFLLASVQHQQHQYLAPGPSSTDLLLDLLRRRPDLLASLQARQAATSAYGSLDAAATSAHAPPAMAPVQPLHKRKRSDEDWGGSSGVYKENDRHEEDFQEEDEEGSAEKEPSVRPRKRVMFEIGSLGEVGNAAEDGADHDFQTAKEDGNDPWGPKIHRSLVEAVFATGIRHASPSVLLNLMVNATDSQLTSERVKSRLQKYRNQADKSKADFMAEYDAFLQRALSIGSQSSGSTGRLLPLPHVLQIMGQREPLYGGDAAAAAAYDMFYKNGPSRDGEEVSDFDSTIHQMLIPSTLKQGSAALAQTLHGQDLEIPKLTDEEKASPLGASLEHVMGAFAALSEELDRQRAQTKTGTHATETQASTSADEARGDREGSSSAAKAEPATTKTNVESSEGDTEDATTETPSTSEKDSPNDKTVKEKAKSENTDKIGALVDLMYQQAQKDMK